jgi:hypothetical protein
LDQVLVDQLPVLRARRPRLPQKLSRRQVDKAVLGDQALALRAFARSRAAQDEYHLFEGGKV